MDLNIVRDSLAIAFDTDSEKSYPESGSSIKNLINNAYGTLSGSPTFDTTKHNTLIFNGTSQRMALGTNVSMSHLLDLLYVCVLMLQIHNHLQVGTIGFYKTLMMGTNMNLVHMELVVINFTSKIITMVTLV